MKKNSFLNKVGTFFKKNMYYVLLFVCVAAVGTMITLTVIDANQPEIKIEAPTNDGNQNSDVVTPNPDQDVVIPTPDDNEVVKPDDSEVVTPSPDEDVSTEPIVFGLPVDGASVICEYSDSTLVYCSTLKRWQTHTGIDYACSEGAEVKSVYGGEVESVTNDSLNGYVVTINHGNGLVTKYGALGSVNVEKGASVQKGSVLGTAGNSALNEVELGTHLHFEALLDGVSVDPIAYSGENK